MYYLKGELDQLTTWTKSTLILWSLLDDLVYHFIRLFFFFLDPLSNLFHTLAYQFLQIVINIGRKRGEIIGETPMKRWTPESLLTSGAWAWQRLLVWKNGSIIIYSVHFLKNSFLFKKTKMISNQRRFDSWNWLIVKNN